MPQPSSQTVFVTAGANGIGLAIARRFARGGANVHVCDVDESALLKLAVLEPTIRAMHADVASETDMRRFFDVPLTADFQVLVNNAGIAGPRGNLEDLPINEWRRTLDINLTGAFLCLQQAARRMRSARAGAVINIVTASVRTGLPSRSAYIASKAGLQGLSNNAARELGPFGIRVNSILPGLVEGARSEAVLAKVAASQNVSAESLRARALKTVSMRSSIHPNEVASMAYWLASPEAAHITGQAIGVDGNLEWEE